MIDRIRQSSGSMLSRRLRLYIYTYNSIRQSQVSSLQKQYDGCSAAVKKRYNRGKRCVTMLNQDCVEARRESCESIARFKLFA